jgi:hypothetical protein
MNNNDEVIGYLGEKTAVLATTTIDNDKPVLIEYIKNFYSNVDLYLHEQLPSVSMIHTRRKSEKIIADEVLAFLSERGLY